MLEIKRRKTRTVKIGHVRIGSGHPVAIQSMVKVPARQIDASVRQIIDLQSAGCEIVRLAVENREDAQALRQIKRRVRLPLVADIHFDYRLALASIDAGVDKVRLNPGNIHRPREIREVIAAAKSARIPIRIGANSGSLRRRSKNRAADLAKSALSYLKIFEREGFRDLVVSLKGSHVLDTIEAYKKISLLCDYPLHLGVTATGLPLDGIVKSSMALGELLFHGIGDTIRVSLLDQPQQEVVVARFLLHSLGLRHFGPELVCCPTCGRCEVNLPQKAAVVEKWLSGLDASKKKHIQRWKIAVMGCVVNGPGEAREADVGIAFSRHKGIIFKKGKAVRTVGLDAGEQALLDILEDEIR
jgi:(E)-4-hydroxy-3-methylbut-2-enyl-diphosphate synthase